MAAEIQNVTRKCCDCGKTMVLIAEEWKWWWEEGGKTPDIMRTSPVTCCGDEEQDEEEDDEYDIAWQSEHSLRRMEGWVE